MSLTRGLTRFWIVLSILYVLAASVATAVFFYELNQRETEIAADFEAEELAPGSKSRLDWRGTPEKRLADLQREQRLAKIFAPLAIVVPPIAVYCLVGAFIWAMSGFQAVPPDASSRNAP